MKKSISFLVFLLAALALAFVLTGMAHAEGAIVQTGNTFYPVDGNGRMLKGTFTVTADAGGVANTAFLDADKLRDGYHLLSVEMVSATDDAFTVTITTPRGTPLFSKTTTAATTGEIKSPAAFWPIYDTPWVDVTDLAAGESCTLIAIFEK